MASMSTGRWTDDVPWEVDARIGSLCGYGPTDLVWVRSIYTLATSSRYKCNEFALWLLCHALWSSMAGQNVVMFVILQTHHGDRVRRRNTRGTVTKFGTYIRGVGSSSRFQESHPRHSNVRQKNQKTKCISLSSRTDRGRRFTTCILSKRSSKRLCTVY